jgi:hypothetical protein
MDYQPLTPPTGQDPPATPTPAVAPSIPNMSSFGSGSSSRGGGFMIILVALLALGTLGFGVLALTESSAATKDQNTLNTDVLTAAKNAASQQQKTDAKNEAAANESPFRSYVSPAIYGSFQINFPKDWSGWVDQEQSGNLITLIVNPDFVQVTNDQPNLAAAKVELIDQVSTNYMQQFQGNVQSGQMSQKNITVSGISAFDLSGHFGDQRTTREVVVPVRNQVIAFINENGAYSSEFNEILAQAKINP